MARAKEPKNSAAVHPQWPADKVERRPVADLIPYARNARTHSDAQVAQIAASVREWGWTVPVLIAEDSTIIAGHGRVLAAQKLGMTDVPCTVAADWTEAQRRAYVIADNKLTLNGGWDDEMLAAEMQELIGLDFDMDLTGFSAEEIAALTIDKTPGLTDPDDAPEAPVNPVSALGDIWLLGRHRLRCGDSTSADDVAALLAGVEPHLMVTDPPYGVEYEAEWRERALGGKRADGKVENDSRADWSDAWALFPGDVAYVWHGMLTAPVVAGSLSNAGFSLRAEIVWAKGRFAISRGDYHAQHESSWYAVRKSRKGHWSGDRSQTTLWQIDHMKSETGHSTQKPVECMRRPIVNNSSPGQAVYEPFSGSGTTIIAGEMEGRAIYAMELHPPYVDVAVKRWQDFTGQSATLEGDGRTFDEVSQERYKRDCAKDAKASYDAGIGEKRRKLKKAAA